MLFSPPDEEELQAMREEFDNEDDWMAFLEENGENQECGEEFCVSLSNFEDEDSEPDMEMNTLTGMGDCFTGGEYSGHCSGDFVPVCYVYPGCTLPA